jgi:nitrite reductase/ring-hydroxylating ferredoxin subunit
VTLSPPCTRSCTEPACTHTSPFFDPPRSFLSSSHPHHAHAQNGKAVVEIGGSKVLLALDGTEVRAVSNKCTHLGLPLVGKTAFLQGEVAGGCVTCSAHGSRFNLTTGAPEGDWCPKMPNLPIVGKGPGPKPLPTYKVTVAEDGAISVDA